MKKIYLLLTILCAMSLSLMAQEGTKRVVPIQDAGTLKDLVTAEELNKVVDLTVTGKINNKDIVYIRKNTKMMQRLDLSDAQIMEVEVSGGSGAFHEADVLDNYSMKDKPDLKIVILPKTLKRIGDDVFQNSGITEIVIPEGVTKLGSNVFRDCANLEKASILGPVESIGTYCFLRCKKLSEVTLAEGMKVLGGDMFNSCSSLKEIKLPSTIEEIQSQAFKGCTQITKMVFPESCKKVSINLFREVPNLEELHCLAMEAPKAHQNSFYPEQLEKVKLFIHEKAYDSYFDSSVWTHFKNIYSIETGKPLANTDVAGATVAQVLSIDGMLVVNNALGETIQVYDPAGSLVAAFTAQADRVEYALPTGKYVVSVAGVATTILL